MSNAVEAANRILGIQPTTMLDWAPIVTAQPQELARRYVVVEGVEEHIGRDSEGFMVEDVLEHELEDEFDSDSMAEDADAEVIWELPVRGCTQIFIHKLTTLLQSAYLLEGPTDLPEDAANTIPALANIRPQVLPANGPRSRVSYAVEDIARFVSPTAMLDDDCINGAALLLQSHFINEYGSSDIAILNTHDLVRVRYGATDDSLWRHARRSEYWKKGTWVLPVHRKDALHWVLCVIHPARKQLHLIDSLAERRGWFPDVKVCIIVVYNYISLMMM